MTKRLQVQLAVPEWREIRRAANAQGLSISEWVRQALRAARRRQPSGDLDRKFAALHAATRHAFPTGDIDQILAEIERGRRTGGPA